MKNHGGNGKLVLLLTQSEKSDLCLPLFFPAKAQIPRGHSLTGKGWPVDILPVGKLIRKSVYVGYRLGHKIIPWIFVTVELISWVQSSNVNNSPNWENIQIINMRASELVGLIGPVTYRMNKNPLWRKIILNPGLSEFTNIKQ